MSRITSKALTDALNQHMVLCQSVTESAVDDIIKSQTANASFHSEQVCSNLGGLNFLVDVNQHTCLRLHFCILKHPPTHTHTQENILLAWLTYHHRNVTGAGACVENFGEDLSDGMVFASVLASHVPGLAQAFFSNMFSIPTDTVQR